MTIIEQIIEELADAERSLTNPLLKTKILANRIGNQDLTNWTNNELNGYGDTILPAYRIGVANYYFDIHQEGFIRKNVPLPLMVFDEQFVTKLTRFSFNDAVRTLETQEKDNRNGSIIKHLPPDFCAYISNEYRKKGQRFEIVSMNLTVHVSQITQVLSEIRTMLLDFILAVEKEFPNLDDIIKNQLVVKDKINEKIENIYNQTIINASGYGNTITAGEGNRVRSKITINQGNIEHLKNELLRSEVPKEDINEILEIVQEEEPFVEQNRFGTKVNLWIQKMIAKTLDGSWQVGTATASGVLVELIKSYYGMS